MFYLHVCLLFKVLHTAAYYSGRPLSLYRLSHLHNTLTFGFNTKLHFSDSYVTSIITTISVHLCHFHSFHFAPFVDLNLKSQTLWA